MKTLVKLYVLFLVVLGSALVSHAQSTAFTYNARLNNNGVPVTGSYDLRFTLYDAVAGGNVIAGPLNISPVDVANGLFTARIDFGAGVFTGPARWLKIEVRPVGGANYASLNPRQEMTSSPYAIQAQTAGSVANGAVTANQLNTGGQSPAPGQFLSYAGGNLVWSDPGMAAGNIWSQLNNNAYYALGKVGVGTSVPLTPLEVNGILRSTRSNNAAQYLQLDGGDPASIRMTAQSTVSAEKSLLIQNLSGEATPGVNNSILFALGTTAAPSIKMTLTKDGNLLLPLGGSGGAIAFGTPNAETGMSIVGANRADIRFDGSTLKLLAGVGTGIPSLANGIAINTVGNVGIGTTTPAHRLSLIGGPLWTANSWSGALEMGNGSAIGWRGNGNGRNFGIGQSGGGLYVFHTASNPGTTGTPANYDLIVTDNSNVVQPRDKGGLVKAMLYVNQDGTIARCYNGITDSSTGGCGFTVNHFASGDYYVDFNFKVDDRFVSVTPRHPQLLSSGVCATFRFEVGEPNRVHVQTFITNIETFGDDTPFMLIVY